MHPIDFEGSNLQLNKPADMTDEECTSLMAWFGETADGHKGFITAWMPNKEDLDSLNRGEPLYLKTLGTSFPPVGLFTMNEAGEANI